MSPVTRGRRYVFAASLFDEVAEKVRLANLQLAIRRDRRKP